MSTIHWRATPRRRALTRVAIVSCFFVIACDAELDETAEAKSDQLSFAEFVQENGEGIVRGLIDGVVRAIKEANAPTPSDFLGIWTCAPGFYYQDIRIEDGNDWMCRQRFPNRAQAAIQCEDDFNGVVQDQRTRRNLLGVANGCQVRCGICRAN